MVADPYPEEPRIILSWYVARHILFTFLGPVVPPPSLRGSNVATLTKDPLQITRADFQDRLSECMGSLSQSRNTQSKFPSDLIASHMVQIDVPNCI